MIRHGSLALIMALALTLASTQVALAVDAVIDSGPPPFTNVPTATFTFSSVNPAGETFQCKLDAAPQFVACPTPHIISGVSEGSHTLQVVAANLVRDPVPTQWTWTVDFTAPDTTMLEAPTLVTTSTTATFAFASPDPTATFECSLNNAPAAPCTSPQVFAGLDEGTRSFVARAVDPSGNGDPSPIAVLWTVDRTAPDTKITKAPAVASTVTAPSFEFSATEEAATYECALNAAPFTPCKTGLTLSLDTDRQETFRVRAIDVAGNPDPTPATYTWTLDTTRPAPPTLRIGAAPPSSGPVRMGSYSASAAPVGADSTQTPPFVAATVLKAQWGAVGATRYDVKLGIREANHEAMPNMKPYLISSTKTKAGFSLPAGKTVCLDVTAIDAAGNTSNGATRRCTVIPYTASQTYVFDGKLLKARGSFGGHVALLGNSGFARLLLGEDKPSSNPSFGAPSMPLRQVAVVVTTCPDCGRIRVIASPLRGPPPAQLLKYTYRKPIDLTASKHHVHRLIVLKTFAAAAEFEGETPHVVTVIVQRLSGHPRIEGIGVNPAP